jgi:ubiquinol-cytochrome c reductase iron-sulfur subunit
MATVKKTTGTSKAPRKNAAEASAELTAPTSTATVDEGEGVRRRDFIHIATVSFAGVGAVAVAIPLVSQMSASADVLALASIEVDVAAIQPGQAIKTSWRKQPVFIRNLTPVEIEEANKVDAASLRDPQTLAERTQPGKENWLITLRRLHPSRLRSSWCRIRRS